MNKHLMVLDLNNLVCRAAFTGADPVRMIHGLIRRHSPTHMVLCRDSHEETWRKALDPTYKANREGKEGPSSNDLADAATEAFQAQGWCIASAAGFEGDDVCATLTKRAVLAGTRVSVVSGDKDLWQLADWATVVYPIPGGERLMDARAVFDALGVWPHAIRDWKALAGDKGDNIPRILTQKRGGGFTPAVAAEVIGFFGNLEDLYTRLPRAVLPEKVLEWLNLGKERAFLNRTLATLREDVPLDVDPRQSRL